MFASRREYTNINTNVHEMTAKFIQAIARSFQLLEEERSSPGHTGYNKELRWMTAQFILV